jgi:hypothetical protein
MALACRPEAGAVGSLQTPSHPNPTQLRAVFTEIFFWQTRHCFALIFSCNAFKHIFSLEFGTPLSCASVCLYRRDRPPLQDGQHALKLESLFIFEMYFGKP